MLRFKKKFFTPQHCGFLISTRRHIIASNLVTSYKMQVKKSSYMIPDDLTCFSPVTADDSGLTTFTAGHAAHMLLFIFNHDACYRWC